MGYNMNKKNLISILLIGVSTLLFVLSAVLLLASGAGEGAIDSEYALLSSTGESKSRRIDTDGVHTLLFFRATEENGRKHTLFKGVRPKVEIIPSEEKYAELVTNSSIQDKVSIEVKDGVLAVDMLDECYKKVHRGEDNPYDLGLYVECEEFTLRIYGGISRLETDSSLQLDMDASGTDKLSLLLSDRQCDANVTGIEASELYLSCSGSGRVALEGEAERAVFDLSGDSRVYARELSATAIEKHIKSDLFGFSCLRMGGFPSFAMGGPILTFALCALPPIFLILSVMLLRRFIGLPMLPLKKRK